MSYQAFNKKSSDKNPQNLVYVVCVWPIIRKIRNYYQNMSLSSYNKFIVILSRNR